MTFSDSATVEFRSGKGGSGAVSFHREKFVPLGGPNGSDGGRGGDVVLIADRNMRTLYEFQRISRYRAEDGVHGLGNKRGKNGKGIEIKVPVGTIVTNAETGEVMVDMNLHGMKHLLLKGGKGGSGNEHYATSIRQAPNYAQKGAPSEVVIAELNLKLIADVGLIGLPNAGKSTLISRISRAKPKIADYPFTTIVPNLGTVVVNDTSFVVADTPGLIEGASVGIGLGHQFLKHVERNRILVHVVDALPVDESDPYANYLIIEKELRLYSEDLFERPRIIALNKIDIVPSGDFNVLREKFEQTGHQLFPISAATGQGLENLLQAIAAQLVLLAPVEEVEIIRPLSQRKSEDDWTIEEEADGYRVVGKRIERLVAMTNLENEEALNNMQRRLDRIGIFQKLRTLGAEEGVSVKIGEFEFEFEDNV